MNPYCGTYRNSLNSSLTIVVNSVNVYRQLYTVLTLCFSICDDVSVTQRNRGSTNWIIIYALLNSHTLPSLRSVIVR